MKKKREKGRKLKRSEQRKLRIEYIRTIRFTLYYYRIFTHLHDMHIKYKQNEAPYRRKNPEVRAKRKIKRRKKVNKQKFVFFIVDIFYDSFHKQKPKIGENQKNAER